MASMGSCMVRDIVEVNVKGRLERRNQKWIKVKKRPRGGRDEEGKKTEQNMRRRQARANKGQPHCHVCF